MRIIGVDPGTIFTGFGILDYDKTELKYITAGVIKMPAVKDIAPRLEKIYNELNKFIKQYKPDEFALETAFYGKNIQSTLKIGYARGVSMLAAIHNELQIKEYSPREIKKAVVGNGASTKEQVQFMIKKLLAINKVKMKYDESDALAVAICHAFKSNSKSIKSKSWKEYLLKNPDRVID